MAKQKARNKNYTPHIDMELDLHACTAHEAREEVETLLHEARANDWKRVRIIVGKGTHSLHGEPVLPNVVKTLLNKHGHTYTYAKIQDGGEGALEVSL